MSKHSLARVAGSLILIAAMTASVAASALAPVPAAAPDAGMGVVNINTASKTELQYLPYIGAKKADRIVEVREKRKFDTLEQIRRVKGIGRGIFRKIKPYLAVSGNTTLSGKVHLSRKNADKPGADANTPDAPAEPEKE